MVFHIMRDIDPTRQEIMGMNSITDPSINLPSWAEVIEILTVNEYPGVALKEGCECLMVNGRVRVANERQLHAYLQHLRNFGTLKSEDLLCSRAAVLPRALTAE